MAVTFTGTNTGKVYVEGKTYSNGNGTYRANADGSFTNLNTGRTAVGSSQSDKVVFGTTSLGSGGGGSKGTGAGTSGVKASGSGSGAGTGGVVVAGGKGPVGTGPGVPSAVQPGGKGAFLGGGFLSGQPVAAGPGKITDVWIGGFKMPQDRGTSDAGDIEQRYGEAEFLSPGWFINWGAQAVNGVSGAAQVVAPLVGPKSDRTLSNIAAISDANSKAAEKRVKDFDADWQSRRDGFDLSGSGL